MVSIKTGHNLNRVMITNNAAKHYADIALSYANQAKTFAENIVQIKAEISEIVQNNDVSVVSNNIEKIITLANSIENMGEMSVEWGDISGDIDLQVDLKTKFDEKNGQIQNLSTNKADLFNVYTKTEIDTKLDGIETLLEGI